MQQLLLIYAIQHELKHEGARAKIWTTVVQNYAAEDVLRVVAKYSFQNSQHFTQC